ncbi:alpha/beta fold hydrolase [Microlunatus panaciterrae]|uniref:Pimeloyl-ACP methyl ester carboxylesterase n=1 Tax=Microlunatus panaciterrae TaxID=400768 RepID=A0ABS2RNK4_9ACTN|nr:alpha/beta fold hydrolase [Microlunatus panaciterrae]MBM7800580.1 pimeloyl-ACP methyl ester carboxylesterase [Microlunatus panaciterrae]
MSTLSPQTATLHGHSLSYLDSGDGSAVLFVHGLLGSHRNWAHLIDRLDDTHRVVVPDLFGHGASAKPMGDYSLGAHAATLRDLLDRLGIDRVTLVGHSLGGGISLEFCYLFPERVRRLILVGSGGLGREVSPLLRSATLPGAELVLSVVASNWVRGRAESVGRVLSKAGWRPGSDLTALWQGYASLGDADSRRAFLATTRAVVDPGGQSVSARALLPEIAKIPLLVVWGTRDRMIPPWHATAAQAAVPGCRVELFEGSGHFPHLDEPDRFAEVVRDFITETEVSPG